MVLQYTFYFAIVFLVFHLLYLKLQPYLLLDETRGNSRVNLIELKDVKTGGNEFVNCELVLHC